MDAHLHSSCFYVVIFKGVLRSMRAVLGLGQFFVSRVLILAVRWLKCVCKEQWRLFQPIRVDAHL